MIDCQPVGNSPRTGFVIPNRPPADHPACGAGAHVMVYRLLADAVVVVHFLFIVFVFLGGLLVLRRVRWAWLHLPAAVWAAWIEFQGWICPLTPLENRLREAGGRPPYPTGFIEHYLVPVIYPPGYSRELALALGLIVITINAAVYALVLRRGTGRRRRP